jgi:hypothetical protein
MLKYVNHDIYQSLTAAAVASVYLIAAIPSALFVGKPKPSAISIIIIFYLLDIKSSPWRNFFLVCWCVELLMAYILHIFIFCYSGSDKENHTLLSYSGAILVGFLAGCSNENTCIVKRY